MNDNGLGLFNTGTFTQMRAIAEVLADSSLLPEHLRGFWKVKANKANDWKGEWEDYPRDTRIANAMLVVNAARLWGCDPFQLATHSYVVSGKMDFDGQVYAAMVNHHGGLAETLEPHYEGDGIDRYVRISGRLDCWAEPREIELALVNAQTKNHKGEVNSQWRKDVDQMLFYAGARKWVRRYCPQVMLGLVTIKDTETEPDELNVIDHKPGTPASQALLEEVAPTKVYSQTMAKLEACKLKHQVESVILAAKSSRQMPEHEREQIVSAGRLMWPKLPDEDDDEPTDEYVRWERTFKTELDRTKLVELAAEMDESFPAGAEKDSLAVIVKECLRTLDGKYAKA